MSTTQLAHQLDYNQITQTQQNAYCLFCISGNEHKVVNYLEDKEGIHAFFPVRVLKEKRAGIWAEVDKPLLPGYVFVFTGEENEARLRESTDVIRVLQYANKDRALRGSDLAFASWVKENGGRIGISKVYKEGQEIKVKSGPLANYEGKIITINERKQRAIVELDFDGRTQRVSLSYEWL